MYTLKTSLQMGLDLLNISEQGFWLIPNPESELVVGIQKGWVIPEGSL